MRWRAPFPKFGVGPGLERVRAVASILEIDLTSFGAGGCVIVGSNGKGSTAAMCAALVQQAAAPVGLFTSPHLFALNERFRIDGEDISDTELQTHWDRVRGAIAEAGIESEFGAFEFLFLIAADWFKARGCAHTIWEAGIGGRFDPSRLIEARRLALTSLDLEHTELLGDTLAAIAWDKLDAAPSGARVFVSTSCAVEAAAIEAHAATSAIDVEFVDADMSITTPLLGLHQTQNATLALRLAQDMAALTSAQLDAGFAATRWPGRLQTIGTAPLVVIDVGHTPAAVRAALEGYAQLRSPETSVLVCGVSCDKDIGAIVSLLAPRFPVIICAAAVHKGAPAGAVAAHAVLFGQAADIAVADDMADAHRLALLRAGPSGGVYVAGGLFLAAEFAAVHRGLDPRSLAFF